MSRLCQQCLHSLGPDDGRCLHTQQDGQYRLWKQTTDPIWPQGFLCHPWQTTALCHHLLLYAIVILSNMFIIQSCSSMGCVWQVLTVWAEPLPGWPRPPESPVRAWPPSDPSGAPGCFKVVLCWKANVSQPFFHAYDMASVFSNGWIHL